MTDYPPGRWSALIVGRQWPGMQSVQMMATAAASRGLVELNYNVFAEHLESAINGPLVDQDGVTADNIRSVFLRGLNDANAISELNGSKSRAYSTAHGALTQLRSQLTGVAKSGNAEIERVQQSKAESAEKLAKIVEIIQRHQLQADHAAGLQAQTIMAAAQDIADEVGAPQLMELSRAYGMAIGDSLGRVRGDGIEAQVRSVLGKSEETVERPLSAFGNTSAVGAPAEGVTNAIFGESPEIPASAATTGVNVGLAFGVAPDTPSRDMAPDAPSATPRLSESPGVMMPVAPAPGVPAAQLHTPTTLPTISTAPSLPTAPAMPTGPGMPGVPGVPPVDMTALPDVPAALTPQGLADGFAEGIRTGTPMSLGASEVVSAALPSPVAPVTQVTPISAPDIPAAPPVVTAPAEHDYQPMVVAQPAPTPGPMPAAPPVAAPVAPAMLPSYGSDLRPVVSPAMPMAPVMPAAPVPTLAPGAGVVNQPAVVRTPASASTPAPASAPYAGPAALAFAAGATAGAVAHERSERDHLRRLLNAVARQQPALAWGIGQRDDGVTLLVTDLAGGWLPPGIEIPATSTVLEPRNHVVDPSSETRGIEKLLGPVVVAAAHASGQRVPDDPEPVNLSTRPVRAPAIEDLGWELCRAAQWRDGLPRLAHTVARAAAADTGVLESEIDLLREHLAAIAQKVLAAYPNSDPQTLGNWQLLAAIEALAAGRRRAANYHLAWFLTSNR